MAAPDERTDDDSVTELRIVWLEASPGRPTFALDHPYVELVYTPLVGATAVLFLRRIALLADSENQLDLDAVALARELGLRAGDKRPLGRHSPLLRALRRLEHHQLARQLDPNRLGVYRLVPAVADVYLPGLPESARRVHLRYTEVRD